MKRFACPCFVLLCCLFFIPAALAQTKTPVKKDATATTTTTAPVSPELMKARMKAPLKGTASIEFIAAKPKIANGEVHRTFRLRSKWYETRYIQQNITSQRGSLSEWQGRNAKQMSGVIIAVCHLITHAFDQSFQSSIRIFALDVCR